MCLNKDGRERLVMRMGKMLKHLMNLLRNLQAEDVGDGEEREVVVDEGEEGVVLLEVVEVEEEGW
jgi:hypothetical protein